VSLASQDICVYPDPIDITATPSNTPIASIFGMNITSDENCYLSYPVVLWISTDGSVEYQPGDILTVPSSNLRSFRGFEAGYTELFSYSFNFADLPPNHVPVLAYEGAAGCSIQDEFAWSVATCMTIYEPLYAPNLGFPTEIFQKYPQWASCGLNLVGLYDPPTSLVPVDFLTPPSTASPTAAASPGSSGYPITPSPTAVPVLQPTSPTTAEPVRSSATAVDSGPRPGTESESESPNDYNPSRGGAGTGSESNGDLSSDSESSNQGTSLANTNPSPVTVITFGNSGGSVAISVNSADGGVVVGSATVLPDQVLTIDGQTVSVLSQSSGIVVVYNGQTLGDSLTPATAVFTLGDGNTVTATSIDGVSGSPVIVVGSQTLTAGQAFTTNGAILSLIDGGLLLSSEASDGAGAIITVNSATITAVESVNNQGSTVIDIEDVGEITVGGPAITLSSGVVISAGNGGLVITSAGGRTSISYSSITVAKSTPTNSFITPSSPPTIATSVISTSKKDGSSRSGIGMKLLVICLFATFWLV